MKYLFLLPCALLLFISPVDCVAQKTNRLPRVGTIKDYPATGLMTGCGNLYTYFANHTGSSADDYVFLARGDGSNAWMNLGGRDVRLRQLKSRTRGVRHYEYRFGELRISADFERFRPEGEPRDSDPMFRLKITLRGGKAVRVVRVVGDSDC